jgi:hypothetical protein
VRDERPWAEDTPQAAVYRLTPDRRGKWPGDHLAGFKGWMQADGYAGFEELYRGGQIREVPCMAHIRRKFFDAHASQCSAIAEEALARIQKLYEIEAEARGQPPDQRKVIRQAEARPIFDDLEIWLQTPLTRISAKSSLAGAIRYALTRMKRLRPYLGFRSLGMRSNMVILPLWALVVIFPGACPWKMMRIPRAWCSPRLNAAGW